MFLTGAEMDAIGYIAGTLTTIAFVPQLLRIIRLRSAHEISVGMFLIFSAGTFSWLVYGFLMHSGPMILANSVSFVLAASILVLKLRFDHPVPDRSAPDRPAPGRPMVDRPEALAETAPAMKE